MRKDKVEQRSPIFWIGAAQRARRLGGPQKRRSCWQLPNGMALRSPGCPSHPEAGPWLPRLANPASTGRTAPTVARQSASLGALSASAREE